MAGFTEPFPVRVKNEFRKIKELKGIKKKIEYIWEYYKIYFIVIIAVTLATISIVKSIQANRYNMALHLMYINCSTADYNEGLGILEGLGNEWLGIDGKDNRFIIEGSCYIDPNVYSEDTYSSQYRLMGQVDAQMNDCFISNEIFMNAYNTAEFFMDLESLLPAELLEKASDRLLYYEDVDGVKRAFGIDLSGLPIMDTLLFSIEKPIFSVVANSPNTENVVIFLENLLEYK